MMNEWGSWGTGIWSIGLGFCMQLERTAVLHQENARVVFGIFISDLS